MNFRNLAVITSLGCFTLAVIWTVFPEVLLTMWGVEFSYPVGLVGRRGGALFAGIGVMFFFARNAEPSPARSAIVSGFVVGCIALASLGLFELATGHAGPGILSAVVVEVALALALSLSFWLVAGGGNSSQLKDTKTAITTAKGS